MPKFPSTMDELFEFETDVPIAGSKEALAAVKRPTEFVPPKGQLIYPEWEDNQMPAQSFAQGPPASQRIAPGHIGAVDFREAVRRRKEQHGPEPIKNPDKIRFLPNTPTARKNIPLYSGLIRYFPDALCAVAELSRIGNDQHNPGEPLHWDRSKSTDELDALARHLFEAGTDDTDGVKHSAKVAWRALAALQREIERERNG